MKNPHLKYDDINTFKGSRILKIEVDSIKTDSTLDLQYKFYIQDSHQRYRILNVDPQWGDIFSNGDVI